jgi:stress response protein SCP2
VTAAFEAPGVRSRILALRIGGNDLLALLGLRRPRAMTIYRTPLGPVIARLVTTFRPYGFVLTAPVFEHLDLPALLDQEVAEDIAYGMVGKTAIHPTQIAPIEQHYRVSCFGVDSNDQLSDERYMVFYNQLASPEGAIRLELGAGKPRFALDLDALPASVARLVFVAVRFAWSGADFENEKAVIVGEIYRKDGAQVWVVKAAPCCRQWRHRPGPGACSALIWSTVVMKISPGRVIRDACSSGHIDAAERAAWS